MLINSLSAQNSCLKGIKQKIEDSLGLEHASCEFRAKQLGLAALSLCSLYGVSRAIQNSFLSAPSIAVPLCVAPLALFFHILTMKEAQSDT